MIERERETSEKKHFSFKQLRLITPERAQRLGIAAEAPVFISPYTIRDVCGDCGVVYQPLIYHLGIVKPHHFHEEEKDHWSGGGIYYQSWPEHEVPYLPVFNNEPFDWIAILELAGRFDRRRTEQVQVVGIKAFCWALDHSWTRQRVELQEGIVVACDNDSRSSLVPLCNLALHPKYSDWARYHFKIAETGEVFFS